MVWMALSLCGCEASRGAEVSTPAAASVPSETSQVGIPSAKAAATGAALEPEELQVVAPGPARRVLSFVDDAWFVMEDGRLVLWRAPGTVGLGIIPAKPGVLRQDVLDFDGFHAVLSDGGYAHMVAGKLSRVPGPRDQRAVAFSLRAQMCVLDAKGLVRCREDREGPVVEVGVDDAVLVRSGNDESCALRRNGDLMCWPFGEPPEKRASGVQTFDLKTRVGCYAKVGAEVSCWGLDAPSLEVTDVVLLSVSPKGGCAVERGGDAHCWGLAKGLQRPWMRGMKGFALGSKYACAILEDKRAACWQ